MRPTDRIPVGVSVLAALVALAIAPVHARATLYQTEVASFNTALGNCTLDPVVHSSPTDSYVSGPAIPFSGGVGGGTTTARATRGDASGHVAANVSWGGPGNQAAILGCFLARCEITDVVISGPPGTVATRFFVDLASVEVGSATGFGTWSGSVSLALRNSGIAVYGFTGSATSVGVSSPTRTATIGVPFTIGIDVSGQGGCTAPDGSSSASIDYGVIASFSSGPVFDLPPGYTANSVDGFVVDNFYVPPVPPTAVAEVSDAGPELLLRPNPFRTTSEITFELPRPGVVQLRVHDVAGRLVKRLFDGSRRAGAHRVVWDGTDAHGHAVGAGVYFLRLEMQGGSRTRRVVRAR